ncbi:F-box/kelch-repeat protein SKIP6-like [Papaver somniferum]|uniref:F-box/kelch-repeat protein SKIP6-like n=1 Tax=Papaver somniferum TaxID=3469 RepID=UPI000E6FC4A4|nr:F-box/kelch-repeat protein SKIP6-like [Papaver somniferum]XP_026387399.1 F-box/kelch-repeat protein SKIP6-like [Papaver somniferum]
MRRRREREMEDSPQPQPQPQPPSRDSNLLIPDLPNDISLHCIARVPHIHHSNLSLVSKSWNSLLRSHLFFNTRFNLNYTQTLLFFIIRIHNSSLKWYFFDPKNPKLLFSVPPNPVQSIGSAFVVLGHDIYVIGGSVHDIPSPNVWVFDSRFKKWELGPAMSVGRKFAAAGVVNGKIYVTGGCLIDSLSESTQWAEVFDPAVGKWEAVVPNPSPSQVNVMEKDIHRCAVIGDKLYAMTHRLAVVYDTKELSWSDVKSKINLGWRGRDTAVVDGTLFSYDYLIGEIRGFDENVGCWRKLKGLDSGLDKFLCGATMANVGGNLCVLWQRSTWNENETEIWCAEISTRKGSCGGELWGSVVWSKRILVVPDRSSVVRCLAVGL